MRASGLVFPSPQDVAEQIQHGLRNPNVTIALVSLVSMTGVEDDFNENDWRAPDTQAVSFHVVTQDRDFLITVEDITATPEGGPTT